MAADTLPAPEPASVLIYGGTVLTLDSRGSQDASKTGSTLRQCEMLVQRGVVASLGKSLTLMPGTQLLDVTGHLVVPGLISRPGTLGTAGADEQAAYEIGLHAAAKMLLDGVTTVQIGPDSDRAPDGAGLRRALLRSGLRAVASPPGSGAEAVMGFRDLRGAENPAAVLAGSTVDAARSLGREGDLGSLSLGKWADLAIFAVEGSQLEETPDERLAELLLSDQAELRHVLVSGTAVVKDGKLQRHDLGALEAAARQRLGGA